MFLRANLEAALAAGAACEVDLLATADGHLVCLHEPMLEEETTGRGPVAAAGRREIEMLRQVASDGTPLDEAPLFLDEIVRAVRRHGPQDQGLVQLDIKVPNEELNPLVLDRFGTLLGDQVRAFTAGGCSWEAILRLAEAAPGLRRGSIRSTSTSMRRRATQLASERWRS